MGRPVVELRDLSFRYRGSAGRALRALTWRVTEGEVVLLTGRTGSGKSTLLRLINGLVPHFYPGTLTGHVQVLGEDATQWPPNQRASQVGTVFQFPEEQVVAATAWRDVAFGPENLGLPRGEILARVDAALDLVGLTALRDREVHTLSGGEQQRLALASALAMDPPVLLLDEPAGELDPRGRQELLEVLSRLAGEATRTVVLADHRIEDVLPWVDTLVVLDRGRVALHGPPQEVIAQAAFEALGVEVPAVVAAWKRLRDPEDDSPPLSPEEIRRWFRETRRMGLAG